MNYYCEKCDEYVGDDGKDTGMRNPPSESEGILCSNCQDIEEMKAQRAKLDTYLEIHDELVDRCEEWLDEFVYMGRDLYDITVKVNNNAYPPYVLVDYMYHNESHFDGEGQEKIPLSIFWDYECVAKEKKKRFDKQMEEMKKREEKKKVQDMKDKATRYEQYLTLCEEFDDEKD